MNYYISFDIDLSTQKMRTILHGKKAAHLQPPQDASSYDDWRRARNQWDYIYNRHLARSGNG
jgi:hypothetical protein